MTTRGAALVKFLTDALAGAIELGVATPDDALRFATPDVLAGSLPRALWGRLLTACLGAARVDAAFVVETVGVPNLCEHAPASVIWACLSDVAARELGDSSLAMPVPVGLSDAAALAPTAAAAPAASLTVATAVSPPPTPPPSAPLPSTTHVTLTTPPSGTRVPVTAGGPGEWRSSGSQPTPLPITPPPAPHASEVRTGSKPAQAPVTPIPAPSPVAQIPSLDILDDLDDPIAPPPAPSPTGRTRGNSRQPLSRSIPPRATAHTTRRPQAQAPTPPPTPPVARRGQTEINDYDVATDVRSADEFRAATGADDLIEWSSGDETVGSNSDDYGRKR
jgi:hypothetical protein